MQIRCLPVILFVTSLAVIAVTCDDDDFPMFWGGHNFGGGGYWNPFPANNYYYGHGSHERMPFGPFGHSFYTGGYSPQEGFDYRPYGNLGNSGLRGIRKPDQWKGNVLNKNILKAGGDSSEEMTEGPFGGFIDLHDGGDSSEEKIGLFRGLIGKKNDDFSGKKTAGLIRGLIGKKDDDDSSEEKMGLFGGLIGKKDDDDSSEEKTGLFGGLIGKKDDDDSSEEKTGLFGGLIGKKDDDDSSEEKTGLIGKIIGKKDDDDSSEEKPGLIGGIIGIHSGSDSSGGTSTEGGDVPDRWGWGKWVMTFGRCSATCGVGTRRVCKTRICLLKGPAKCPGRDKLFYNMSCTMPACPSQGYGGWSPWVITRCSTCSKSCGGGTQVVTQSRSCINFIFKGLVCNGRNTWSYTRACNTQACTVVVNGCWSAWVEIKGLCPVTCGGGKQMIIRTRTCSNPAPSGGGLTCSGTSKDIIFRPCNVQPCTPTPTATPTPIPVHGQWSPWVVSVGQCSVPCGGGVRVSTRRRQCSNPPPSNGGNNCEGKATISMKELCNTRPCAVHGQWSPWVVSVGQCSVPCGGGVRVSTRRRQCSNPPPSNGGNNCEGKATISMKELCNMQPCGEHGQWSPWVVSVGQCSVPCGGGVRVSTRRRQCSNPPPSNGGNNCEGKATISMKEMCNMQPCAVHGLWSPWVVSVGQCSVPCGGGVRVSTRRRQCSNPPPSNGGNNCEGKSTISMKQLCNMQPCAVHGQWSPWVVSVGQCSVPCGGGDRVSTRRRQCSNPPPSNGGNNCEGKATISVKELCNMQPCAVHGQWSPWVVSVGQCSVPCGGGVRVSTRRRQCSNPPPSNGGNNCEGKATISMKELCNMQPCAVHGQWSPWVVSVGQCSVPCGGGVRVSTRRRQCTNPPPSNGGNNCEGKATISMKELCNMQPCAVDGQWSAWVVSYGQCSMTCGGGQRVVMKERKCDSPRPSNGGNYCKGEATSSSMEACNTPDCWNPVKVDGQWSAWVVSYGQCSVSCGGGQRVVMKERRCDNPRPSNGGNYCKGEATSSTMEACNTQDCNTPVKVDGQWSAWVVSYGQCSVSCGGGQRVVMKERKCDNPRPSNGGNYCKGEATSSKMEACNTQDCNTPVKVDGQWSAWVVSYGQCSVSCGGGQRVVMKERKCDNPRPSNGGNYCKGEATSSTMEACNTQDCWKPARVDGQWSEWVVSYGQCSVTCGGGQRVVMKERKCDNPRPSNGGNYCKGQTTSNTMEACNTQDCWKPARVDGRWSAWVVSYGQCSVSCGGGQRVVMKERKCDNPRPSNGGKYCKGEATSSSMEACNTNRCPPAKVDGQWSAWKITYGQCSKSCGEGQKAIVKHRTCTNPPPSSGGRPCVGDSVQRGTARCFIVACPGQPDTGVCRGSTVVRGVGFNPDELDCSMYVQCDYEDDDDDDNSNNVISGVFYRQCPHGLHWGKDSLICSLPEIANCPFDKCKAGNIQTYTSSSLCNGYWECVDGKSVGRCCPKGQAYVADGYCVTNHMCRDTCSLPDTCDKRPVIGQPTMFEQYIAGSGWQMLMCKVGESFDAIICMCAPTKYNGTECKAEVHITFDTGVVDISGNDNYLDNNGVLLINGTGYFDGKSGIVIPRFSSVDYGSTVIMKVKYKEDGVATGQQAIITNADCGSVGSLFITRGANATYFGERDQGGTLTTVTIQHTNDDWKDAQFELFDGRLTGTVNYVSSFAKCEGSVEDTDCAIHVGRGTGFDNFHGYIDELAIYLCKPV